MGKCWQISEYRIIAGKQQTSKSHCAFAVCLKGHSYAADLILFQSNVASTEPSEFKKKNEARMNSLTDII